MFCNRFTSGLLNALAPSSGHPLLAKLEDLLDGLAVLGRQRRGQAAVPLGILSLYRVDDRLEHFVLVDGCVLVVQRSHVTLKSCFFIIKIIILFVGVLVFNVAVDLQENI